MTRDYIKHQETWIIGRHHRILGDTIKYKKTSAESVRIQIWGEYVMDVHNEVSPSRLIYLRLISNSRWIFHAGVS